MKPFKDLSSYLKFREQLLLIERNLLGIPICPRFEILLALMIENDGISLNNLSKRISFSVPGVRLHIKQLLLEGLIEEFSNHDDKRIKFLTLSKKGHERIKSSLEDKIKEMCI